VTAAGGVRRTWDGASSRVRAAVQGVTAAGGMKGVLELASQRLQTAVHAAAIAERSRSTWARTARGTRAVVERIRTLAGEHQAWRLGLRRVAALRLAGARVGTLATILLAGLLAGAASFVGANVLHRSGSRLAHSTPRPAPATTLAASGSPPLACMPMALHPATCEADAPVTAMFALRAAEMRESTAQPNARQALRRQPSSAAPLRRPHGAASRRGAAQASGQPRLVAMRSRGDVAPQDGLPH